MANQFFIKKTDTLPALEAQLINVDGTYNPVLNVSNIKLNISGRGRRLLQATPVIIIDIPLAKVKYQFQSYELNILGTGTFDLEFQVTYLDQTIQTFPNDGEELQLVIT